MTHRGLVDEDMDDGGVLERLGDAFELEVGAPEDEDKLMSALDDKDVLFTTSRLEVTRRVLEATNLSVVAKIGTGVDNVDLAAAHELGIPVTYTPGVNTMAVAEHTVLLVLAVTRQAMHAHDHLRSGGWRDDLDPGVQLHGDTVGVVGFGNVGRPTASLLSGFQARILAHDPYIDRIETELTGATLVDFDTLLDQSDVIVVTAELTQETQGMFGSDEFVRMNDSAIIVNTARGPIVSQNALVEAIRNGEIAGAGLDVFEREPLPADSPLHELNTVVTTPIHGHPLRECNIYSP